MFHWRMVALGYHVHCDQNKRTQRLFITLDSPYRVTVAEWPLWCFPLPTRTDTELSRTLGPQGLGGGGPTDRRLNIYVPLNINTLSHKYFIIGVLFYNWFTTYSRSFLPFRRRTITYFLFYFLPCLHYQIFAWPVANSLSKLWHLYFLLADNTLRNQFKGFS